MAYTCLLDHRCTVCGRAWTHDNDSPKECYIENNTSMGWGREDAAKCQECHPRHTAATNERFVDEFKEWAERVRKEHGLHPPLLEV